MTRTMVTLQEAERRILNDPDIQQVAVTARAQGLRIYLVGGAIRDIILGRPVKDYDFVIEQVVSAFFDKLGAVFQGTYFAMGKGRPERVYRLVRGDRTFDFTVLMEGHIHKDLMRRDFTINAMAYSFVDRRFHASSRAWRDLQEGKIDLLSAQAITNDPLRMLRAVREQYTLPEFSVTSALRKEIISRKNLLTRVAAERIRAELDEIILCASPGDALRFMHELGVLTILIPELGPLEGVAQGRHHTTDVLVHSFSVVERVAELARKNALTDYQLSRGEHLIVRYAALLHDLGKPETIIHDEDGEPHFYGHAQRSADLCHEIMARLKFPNRTRDAVAMLVEHHMRVLTLARGAPREAALRRLIHAVGDNLRLLLLLGLAESMAKGLDDTEEEERILSLCRRILKIYSTEDIVRPPSLIKGDDLLALGYRPGPQLGEILKDVRRRQIDGELKTKDDALAFVKEHHPSSMCI